MPASVAPGPFLAHVLILRTLLPTLALRRSYNLDNITYYTIYLLAYSIVMLAGSVRLLGCFSSLPA